ncbi:MAG TPA: MBL fold metallo-hydrolase [Thermoleophilaceae bacterium]|nr:MBL fold metallo-hydrolase [Thermoleophilaceae bacterium]
MKELADGVWSIRGFPPEGINCWLIEDVLLDAATRRSGRRILKGLAGREVSAHALTHVHPDHQGATKEVCEKLGIPLWVGRHDVAAMESGEHAMGKPGALTNRVIEAMFKGPPHKVDRALDEGDVVAGFQVLHVPGHTPGHLAYWRESDRTLILGDVLNSMDPFTSIRGLREPKRIFTPDPAENRRSARRLAELEPALVCFGHGPPLRDTRRFVEFCERLPL